MLHGDGRANGWLERGLRMTKGVFPLASTPPNRPPAPSLQDEHYRALIQALFEDGSEIVPHALNESGNIDSHAFQNALVKFSSQWSPRTWIDHGSTLHYCYTMGGAANSEYKLIHNLSQNGFTALWSYHDIPCDASSSLNLLAPPISDLNAIGTAIMRHLSHGRILVALRYLRSALHWHTRGPIGLAMQNILTACRSLGMTWWRTRRLSRSHLSRAIGEVLQALKRAFTQGSGAFSEPYTRKELLTLAAVVYPERGVPLNQVSNSEMLLFATTEVLHTRDVYTPKALCRLIDERGLHIGHCYLLNQLPYVAGIFMPRAVPLRLTSQWIEFLESLSEYVRSGRLWNPTLGDLVDHMRALQHITCIPDGEAAMQLSNALPGRVSDFTLLLPRSVSPSSIKWSASAPKGYRYWQDWLAVWGDLPAKSQTLVRWDSCRRGGSN